MIPRVEEAHYVEGFTIHLRFSDGTEGDVDLGGELYGEIFEPLKDPVLFRQFMVHPEFRTLSWPNGADFAPEFLYDRMVEQAAAHGRAPVSPPLTIKKNVSVR